LKKLFILLVILGLTAWWRYFTPGTAVEFEIPDHAVGAQIAARLKSAGVISSPLFFRVLLKVTGTAKRLKPGRYEIRTGLSEEQALWFLLHTDGTVYARVTFPEGWRLEEYAQRLENENVAKAADFIALAKKQNLEGFLFPSTYFFEPNTPPQTVINVLKKEFDAKIGPLLASGLPDYLTARDVLTIASIVQREAVFDDERPLVAAVYLNRMRMKKHLEADPTVQYALGYSAEEGRWWKKGLTLADLQFNSPYNTYRYDGIPPGPICNPGYESVYAVLHPAPIDAVFFVADTEGRHTFNVTYEDHLKAKALMKKRLRQARN